METGERERGEGEAWNKTENGSAGELLGFKKADVRADVRKWSHRKNSDVSLKLFSVISVSNTYSPICSPSRS
jgi:hypothetical protein